MRLIKSLLTFSIMIKYQVNLKDILEYVQDIGIGLKSLKITDLIKEKLKYIFLKIYFLNFLNFLNGNFDNFFFTLVLFKLYKKHKIFFSTAKIYICSNFF